MPNFSILSVTPIAVGFGIVILGGLYYFLNQEVTRRRRVEVVLRQQTERERLVNQIAQHIRESLDLDEVLATTVAEVQQFLQADRVLIYRLWKDGTGSAITEAALPNYIKILGETFPEEVFPKEYHDAYSLGKTRTITNVEQEDVEPCLKDFVKQFGVKAKLVVPILQENREADRATSTPYLWGLLIAHQCDRIRKWECWEVELMKQLATQVAIAIQQSELYKQLQTLNASLELRVQQRTSELTKANISLRAEIAERQRTQAALQALINASPRAIFTIDLVGNVQIWNPAAQRMFGWTEAEVIDRPSPIFLDDKTSEYNTLRESIFEGTTYTRLELRPLKKDGTPIDIIFSAAPLYDSDNTINGIVAVIADITEQKQREEQVRLLQSVVVNTNDAVVITEAEPINQPGPRIIYVNEAFTRTTGYSLEEVLGKTPRILQGSKTSRIELDKVCAALLSWESVTVEVINYRKDGSEFWNELSIVPVADKTGYYTHWISIQRDITGRKQAEQALKQSEERFRSLIENTLDIVKIIDIDGIISYVSPSVEKVLGYLAAELIGKNLLNYIHQDDSPNTYHSLISTIQNPKVAAPIEFRCQHKDGSWRTLEAISQRFVDNAADTRIMVNCRDITERKRLDEIRLTLERERELSILKTRFFSMASHEFRTPLSTALAAAQLLENCQDEWDNSSKRLRNLQRIQISVKNMVQMLDDILTINRAETGKLEFNPKPLDLQAFCSSFLEEMRLSIGEEHTLTFSCQGKAVSACVDERLLRSILSNLLLNAIKYSPQVGNVHLALEFKLDTFILQVHDQGIGIPLTDQKQLFEPFHRGKNVRSIPGTGLGLVVVKKCVDLHQGNISITSEVGIGTTCVVTLPFRTYVIEKSK
ncbi:PAS domain S-box protein [Calothrix sp. PCC 6303]|uniref:PAS domain S-box protein n=1 Tax=Calothrix sp. PCC 6303 TaxID=1170562 RepID=UPI0002A01588|nr:PAS domain S-box protein [Calothrix sp. PCC 6303]AFZ00587.1 multi-sensor signal transduction histidine kinase [Calothrix sp. PCC 6303]